MSERNISQQRLLAMDTSTKTLASAILEGGQVVQASHSAAERNHALKLLPVIQEMLAAQKLQPKELDGIAVGIGPGSYTGVRVGVTAAKTLAWSLNKPVLGVSSLYALALNGVEQAASILKQADEAARFNVYPLMDARRGQVYTGGFSGHAKELLVMLEQKDNLDALERGLARDSMDEIILFEKVAEQAKGQLHADSACHIVFAGETVPQLKAMEQLAATYSERVHILSCEIDAGWVGRAGLLMLEKGKATPVHQLEPNYTQLTEAETKLKAREQEASQRS
ncbi:tRNA (adenosine(37)-N6)-threonylcarbamoyltransferase complex dimerization subunit type 1 TsaB [Paenibacillus sp. 1001270B_150601_E10]|uniref:tRNA (adenosine(37)-N6)-threonylcarbamoyltransferase complex dimerization subunit type 1 TsaB n=1 Tax=Paenibacillus sp. 1001270B_150601_E10 TaxID=2787079 RepID=UPI001E4F038D|nr:tRNA (adenosine(37)-N6)-threonylcarbamoyltransferase complex dimerization subunit type 1 TsaB [Paenibacillus sp. 1001270B_150601_E10]